MTFARRLRVDGTPIRRWASSDHFDGDRFFNPTMPARSLPSLRGILKMSRTPRSQWPAWVDNKGVPRLDQQLRTADIAITFVNHVTFLIQTGGITIVTDPVWSERVSPFGRFGPKRVRPPGVPFADLPRIDVVLISHNHYDHLDIPTLTRLRQRCDPIVLAAAGDARLIEPLGFKTVRELDWWHDIEIGNALRITFVPAQHFSARGLFDRRRSLWGGYVIASHGRRLYFSGDTGYSTHFADIKTRLGSPDIAMLGIGAYEPQWFLEPMHMNPAQAVCAHKDLGSRQSIGMHFGTFQLSAEAIDQPQEDLKLALLEHGLSETEFVTLHEGETRVF